MQGTEGNARRRTCRRIGPIVATLVALVLLGGCFGGQTGQADAPTEGQRCEMPGFQNLPYARDFEGQQRAPLAWERDNVPTVRDELIVSISFGPTPHVSGGCGNGIAIEVGVEVATRDLGTLESAMGVLSFNNPSDTQHATLDLTGHVVNVDAILTHTGPTTEPSGVLEAVENTLPGDRAVFPAP